MELITQDNLSIFYDSDVLNIKGIENKDLRSMVYLNQLFALHICKTHLELEYYIRSNEDRVLDLLEIEGDRLYEIVQRFPT